MSKTTDTNKGGEQMGAPIDWVSFDNGYSWWRWVTEITQHGDCTTTYTVKLVPAERI